MTDWRIDMARRNVNFYLLKLVRISGWVLFLLMLVYIATGYALCGEFGFARLIDPQTALRVHKELDVPLVVVFLAALVRQAPARSRSSLQSSCLVGRP